MRILVAVPTYETIYPDVFRALWYLDRGGHEVLFEFVRGYDVATARNNIVRVALNKKADYVLMVDNDVILPPDALVNLLDGGKDVVLGYYAHREPNKTYDGKTCVGKLENERGEVFIGYPLEALYTGDELKALRDKGETKVEVHGGGMGCALLKTSLFKRFTYPWFAWVNYNDEQKNVLSEDLYFCEQLHCGAVPIYTDTRVGCAHIMRNAQWP